LKYLEEVSGNIYYLIWAFKKHQLRQNAFAKLNIMVWWGNMAECSWRSVLWLIHRKNFTWRLKWKYLSIQKPRIYSLNVWHSNMMVCIGFTVNLYDPRCSIMKVTSILPKICLVHK
jgi:hypothetical protein